MKDEENQQDKESDENKKKLDELNQFPGEKLQNPEISPEQQEERAFQSGLLFEQTEQFTEQDLKRKQKRDKEIEDNRIIEFADGRKITLRQLITLVVGKREPYRALFPNESEFFPQVFRLMGIKSDPKQYSKPYPVSQAIRRVIYNRFQAEVLPVLDHLNPIVAGGFRKYKLSQYLNKEAKEMVIGFREEAISLMKTFADLDWYGFEKAYSKKYKRPFQKSLFDSED